MAQWMRLADMPTARTAHAVGLVNGKLYAVGGEQEESVILEEYDPLADSWTPKRDMPTERGWLSFNSVKGKLYAIGGYNASFPQSTVPNVEEYNPAFNLWFTKSPLPAPRWGHGTGVVNEKIYVVGGANVYPPTAALTVVEEYDPVSDTWTTKAPMPVGRIALASSSVSMDGKIFVVGGGGVQVTEAYSEVFVYKSCDYWPQSAETFPRYISIKGDTLKVNAHLANSENHQLSAYAVIIGDEHALQDSIQLFDDGQHGDENISDNIWGSAKWLSGLPEDMFTIKININDTTHSFPSEPRFTTIGPLRASAIHHDYIEPARRQKIKLALHNAGSERIAENLEIIISSTDSRVEEDTIGIKKIPDLAAGTTDTSSFTLSFTYAEGYGPDSIVNNPLHFDYTISEDLIFEQRGDEIPFWTGSFFFPDTVTGVEDRQEISFPEKFTMYQNYPNPFNPITTIEFFLPKSDFVQLNVFDTLGREVATLVSKKLMPGNHSYQFDGSHLASGIYYYKLTTNQGHILTRKLVLLK